jgi:hypothetical protein
VGDVRDDVEREDTMLDQQQDAEHDARERAPGEALYRRPMPGGGYVEVELVVVELSDAAAAKGGRHRGRVVMERRADPGRRAGHPAPVVAELKADDRDELMGELFRLAQDNAALARSLMRWQARRPGGS